MRFSLASARKLQMAGYGFGGVLGEWKRESVVGIVVIVDEDQYQYQCEK
jgi:hypothetical protein